MPSISDIAFHDAPIVGLLMKEDILTFQFENIAVLCRGRWMQCDIEIDFEGTHGLKVDDQPASSVKTLSSSGSAIAFVADAGVAKILVQWDFVGHQPSLYPLYEFKYRNIHIRINNIYVEMEGY